MGSMTVYVNSEVEERFRKTVLEVKGVGKENFDKAVEEALELWCSQIINVKS